MERNEKIVNDSRGGGGLVTGENSRNQKRSHEWDEEKRKIATVRVRESLTEKNKRKTIYNNILYKETSIKKFEKRDRKN